MKEHFINNLHTAVYMLERKQTHTEKNSIITNAVCWNLDPGMSQLELQKKKKKRTK